MKLSPPRMITFWISVALVVLGLIGSLADLFGVYSFWLVFAGYVVLLLGNLLSGF